jgi:hypothetical protein
MQTRFSVMTGHGMLWPDAIQPSFLDEFSRNLAEGDGKAADGKHYRYQGQNGEVHWNGEVQASKVPKAIRKQLNAKSLLSG